MAIYHRPTDDIESLPLVKIGDRFRIETAGTTFVMEFQKLELTYAGTYIHGAYSYPPAMSATATFLEVRNIGDEP